MQYIDRFLNNITMYFLMRFGLLALAFVAIVLSVLGVNDVSALAQIVSLIVVPVTVGASYILSKFFGGTFNLDSAAITGLIVYFLFEPSTEIDGLAVLLLAGILAIASKFLIAPSKRHLLNPAAAAAVIIGLLSIDQAIWWIARTELVIPMLILGFLVLRKLHRFQMFFGFYIASLLSLYFLSQGGSGSVLTTVENSLYTFPTLFLGTIMLTEPLTTPPKKRLQIFYGIVVGLLFGSGLNVGGLFMTPELALVTGNVVFYFSFLQSRVSMKLQSRNEIADSIYEFNFQPSPNFSFSPGEYLEFTTPKYRMDLRGNRRSFSIASAPSEENIKIAIKMPPKPSSFKSHMLAMQKRDELLVNHRQGDFTLSSNPTKCVFIAGGIGITPFRSMIVEQVTSHPNRHDIVLFYQASYVKQFAFRDIFDASGTIEAGIKTIYVTDAKDAPKDWDGETGYINTKLIETHAPDFRDRIFYLSGPNAMVEAYSKMLRSAGISRHKIRTDYFSGY